MNQIRVRFAPSPTGYLHVGGARTLLFNWLFAKKMKGTLVLRVEDTDQNRSTRESERMILSDISRLGLDYQEGPTQSEEQKGHYGPYRQSERLNLYAQYAKILLDAGRVYYCFCSDELLTQKRQMALKLGKTPHYDGTCARLSPEDVKSRLRKGERAGLRFRASQKTFVLDDIVRGRIEFKEGMVGDFFVTRSPGENEKEIAEGIGFPVYNFCCAIDDHLMNLSHVIRAEEHLSNTVRQLMIYDAFGWEPPQFAHIALVLGSDRQKLSKRSGDVSVFEYLEKGYLPEALLNFLVLIGWWPAGGIQTKSGHPEVFSLSELVEAFDLKGLQKASGVFDIQKLNWMNSYYIHHMDPAELARRARPFFKNSDFPLEGRSDQWFQSMIEAIRGEVKLLGDFPEAAKLFLRSTPVLDQEARAALHEPSALAIVEKLELELRSAQGELGVAEVEKLPKTIGAVLGVKGKALYMPMRAVITGKTHGPELKQILPLLGREAVLKRVKELREQAGL